MSSYRVIAGPDTVTVDDTATGQTLETLLGEALHASLVALTLIPHETGIYFNNGSAAATTAILVPISELGLNKTYADTLKFFAASEIKMSVIQHG